MDFTASIDQVTLNINDSNTLIMTVTFTDPNEDAYQKSYMIPVGNTADDNQALIQADIDAFTNNFQVANQDIVDLINAQDSAGIKVSADLANQAQQSLSLPPAEIAT